MPPFPSRHVSSLILAFAGSAGAVAAEPSPGSGLIAHWPFDADAASSVNDAIYRGEMRGGARVSIDRAPGAAKVGAGALRIASARRGAERGYVAVENPLWGEEGTGVLCVTAWLKPGDIDNDGMDATNVASETFPTLASLGIGVRTEGGKKRATFRFRTADYRIS